MTLSRRGLLVAGSAGLAGAALGALPSQAAGPEAAAWETVLDGSFSSYSSLEANWNYRYPWGSDHNGSARMYASPSDHNHVFLDGSTLVLLASRIDWNEGNSSADPHLPIRYHSGAVHAKTQVRVTDQFPNWEVKGEFQAPSSAGTWPAFWLTGANSWPPESDILEYKGDARNWCNTYKNGTGGWSSTTRWVSNPGGWHSYRAWIAKVSPTDVDIHYYIDGTWIAQHRGANFVNQPLWLIMNLQMEGSSGSSGPAGHTYYRGRNVYIGRSRV